MTFLGSIILIKDELFDQVEPAIKEYLPREVMVVIDGQQRLTTLSLFGSLLHNQIYHRGMSLRKKDFPGSAWLINRFEDTAVNLRPLFQLDKGHGEKQMYPKIVRAYHDQWSTQPETALYTTPVASYLDVYIEHCSDKDSKELKNKFKPEGDSNPGEKSVGEVLQRFNSKHLKQFSLGVGADGEQIYSGETPFPKDTQKYLFKDELPEELDQFLLTEGSLQVKLIAVSYTHLTLPTIYSV